ncbi:MAG: T9SS type A sorting domain-containing protein [Bacteroidota bacterium]
MKSIVIILSLLISFSYSFSQTNGCATPTVLTVNTSCSTSAFSVGQNGTTNEEVNASCATGTDYSDGWYSVVGNGNTMSITISSTNFDACLAAFTSCASGEVTCQMVSAGASSSNSISFATTNLTLYYIQIQRRSGAANDDLSGNICAVSTASGGGGNDLCSGAIVVACGGTYSGTTVGSTTTGETALPACGTSPGAGGVWYVFTGDGSTITASLCSGTAYDTKINAYSGTGACGTIASCVASNDDGCSTQSTITFSTVAGTNYYILVNGYSSATGAFSLEITCCTPGVPSCATLNSPANAATGVASCSSLSWTAPATSGCSSVDSYDVYYGTTNPPPFYANTTSTTFPITGAASTVYYWQIRPKNSSGSAAGCTIRSFTSAAGGNPQYTMVDDATSPSPYNCVNLTTTTNDQRGCAWDMNSTLNFTANFSYDFTVNLGASDAGADGMAFTMQNDPQARCKCGTTGGSLGSGGITNSVVIEIDTYLNYEDRDDFNSSFIGCGGSEDPDHLDIWYNGNINPSTDGNCDATGAGERPATTTAVRLRNGGSNYNIENGSNHILRIAWNSGSTTLTATVLNTALSTTYGTISATFNPLTVFGTNTPYFGFTASTGGLNNSQMFCNPSILLPVELMSFNAYCYENYRKIYWSTASENNNAFFTIEKSLDGIHFEVFEIVQANNLKTGTKEYELLDEDIKSKTVYYRLSQTDLNGVNKTFDVISSNCNNKSNSLSIESVFENSFATIEVEFNAVKEENHLLTMFDVSGKIVHQETVNTNKGLNKIEIPASKFSSGMYVFQVSNSEENQVAKFLR